MLSTWDFFYQFIWFGLPILVIVKTKGIKSIALGAVAFWLLGLLEGALLSYFDPNRGGLIDSFWLIIGLPAGVFYSTLIYFGFSIVRKVFKKS